MGIDYICNQLLLWYRVFRVNKTDFVFSFVFASKASDSSQQPLQDESKKKKPITLGNVGDFSIYS